MMKYFEGSLTKDDILYKESWQNLNMMSAVIPSADDDRGESKTNEPVDFFSFCKGLSG